MLSRLIHVRWCSVAVLAAAAAVSCVSIGCGGGDSKPKPVARVTYPDIGVRKAGYPEYLYGTIDQYTDLHNTGPNIVTGFGLVVNTDPIPNSRIAGGSQQYPTAVREYMLREMQKRRVGSPNQPGWEKISPETMLADPRNAIVIVQGLIPPGARGGRSMDIQVQALRGSSTVSLARGWLYQTDLAPGGANIRAPGVAINILAKAQGQVFVNPALALNATAGSDGQRASLREGVILDGGYIAKDRPLVLELRTPQLSLSRTIEFRIDQAFQDPKTAAAEDEGLVKVFVPKKFGTDWEHFAGVMRYLYLNTSPDFVAHKASELVIEAQKPNAPLEDISYAWEGLGKDVIPYLQLLMVSDKDDVAYAAARADAWVGDRARLDALVRIARKSGNRFQVNAIETLGALEPTMEISSKIRSLLDSPDSLVRIEAYRVLTNRKGGDSAIFTRVIAQGNEKFVLDIVPSNGPPLIYASRTGMPRIAVIGAKPAISLPLMFTALDNRLTISSNERDKGLIDIYYRGSEFPKPINVPSRPDVAEVIARLGGEGPAEDDKLDFGYSDVIGMLQSLADSHKLVADYNGQQVEATFVLQRLRDTPDDIRTAPLLPGEAQPQPNPSGATSSAGN